jgi:release factor glutamine methyltransferase
VQQLADRLAAAGCVAPDEEARLLVAAAPDSSTLDDWVRRREQGEPLAWITGTTDFAGHTIHVDPGVYVPRPQTEDLARRAAALLPAAGTAADLCTGTGAVAAYLRGVHPEATVVGVDLDLRAAACAQRNDVAVLVADVGDALRSGVFDVVTAVAPYVPTGDLRFLPFDVQRHEPPLALDGGIDGLGVLRRVVRAAARLVRPGGWLVVEVGGEQDRALQPVLDAQGFGPAEAWFDDEGDLRGLVTELNGAGSTG